jgi:transposase-like protein
MPPTKTEDLTPECPYCGSTETELHSAFGSEISKSQYYCRDCRTVFERIKYDGNVPDTGR